MPPRRRTPSAPRVTIRDVAKAAEVSTATVSYVLNDVEGQKISESTRDRVRHAAASLGYAPHGVARALREGTSRIVLLNVGQLVGGAGLDTFIAGMARELRELGHTLLVTAVDGGQRKSVPEDVLAAVTPRAVLDVAGLSSEMTPDGVVSRAIQGYYDGLASHTKMQLAYLAERGHRSIAFAVPRGQAEDLLVQARVRQIRVAADELGLHLAQVVSVDWGDDGANVRRAVQSLVKETAVTAVAAYSDHDALQLLSAMAESGYRAPDDLAVVGLGDVETGRFWKPSLTTVRIDSGTYGRRAARVVLGLEPGEWPHAPSWVVARESA